MERGKGGGGSDECPFIPVSCINVFSEGSSLQSHRGAIVAVANAYSLEAPGCSSPESVDPQETHAHPHVVFIASHGCTKGEGGRGGGGTHSLFTT